MNIVISNLPFQGQNIEKMLEIPSDIGIEIFSEFGSAYYWDHWLPRLLKGRTGEFTVHGPFQNLDLSDPASDFDEMRSAYQETFALCARYGAKHCVCHPYGGARPEADTPEALCAARQCSLERILQLNQDAKQLGVEILVENMPQKHGMLDEESFIELFAPHEELNFLIDTGHANLQSWDMDMAFRRLGSRIKGYHINDNLGDIDNHLGAWEGTFPWERFFAGCTRYTPQAVLVCEYNNGPVVEILKSVDRIREQLMELSEKN